MALEFTGFRRPDGSVGVRNHVLVLPTVACSTTVADRIGRAVPGAIALTHQHGCAQVGADRDQTARALAGVARNPNVGAVLLVGLGCEGIPAEELAEAVAPTGKPVETIVIQRVGGTRHAIAQGTTIAERLLADTRRAKREACAVSELVIGTECGGSDAYSGLSANPAVGVAADLFVGEGATVILAETTEMIGAEHLLAARADDPTVSRKLAAAVARIEREARQAGADVRTGNPSPGNRRGGLTTLEEKSLGCIRKGGTTPIRQMLAYGERPTKRGLVLMDTPGQDVESVTGLAAGGVQLVLFTTGRGSPIGGPGVPVVKIASTTALFARMPEDMDFNAGTILDGSESIEQAGRRLFDLALQVAEGRLTCAEELGAVEFGINRIGPTA